MKVIKMDSQGLNREEKEKLAEKISDVAKDMYCSSKEDLKVYFYDRQFDQPRH